MGFYGHAMLQTEAAGCKISSVAILVGWDGAQWLGPTVSVLWPFWEVGWFDDPPSLLACFASSILRNHPNPLQYLVLRNGYFTRSTAAERETLRKSLRKCGHPKLIRILQPDKQSHKAGYK